MKSAQEGKTPKRTKMNADHLAASAQGNGAQNQLAPALSVAAGTG
jgi:hypothetical protein